MASKAPLKINRASRKKVKASIQLQGLSGTGKSGLALAIGYALCGDFEKIGCIDTENNSLLLYPGTKLHIGEEIPDGSLMHIGLTDETGYAPTTYKESMDMLIENGCDVVIMDSISHMWTREDGVLAKVSKKTAQGGTDNYRVWGDDEIVKEKNEVFELVRNSKAHVISTVRVKEKFAMVFDETKGKNAVESKGEQQVQQDGLKYEYDLVLNMEAPGHCTGSQVINPKVTVIKSRYPMFVQDETIEVTPKLLKELHDYLEEGASVEELEESRRQEYIEAVKNICENDVTKKTLWSNLKNAAGHKDTKLNDMTLDVLKDLYAQLAE